MKSDLSAISLSTARERLRRREVSAVELTEACLDQIERLNPTLNAFITPTPESARREALQADTLLAAPPPSLEQYALLGIPLAVKDIFDTAAIRTTAGSMFFADRIPAEDAQTVRKLKLSGGVVLGKTNTHEIALGVTGVNPHYGAVKNPWDLTRVTGGSSSGSAAAVASGMCLAALGSDTGGSIRIPASLCGVVGFKPTYGRVSTRGVLPLSWNLDHIGPLTRTVRDAAVMLTVMAGFDPHDPASADVPVEDYLVHLEDGVRNWHIAIAAGDYVEASDPQVLTSVSEGACVFKELGAQLEKVEMSWLADLALANVRMVQADGAAFHRERLAEHPDRFGADVRERLETGAALTSGEYALARRKQTECRRRFETFFQEFDLLLLPTTPTPAPPIEGTHAVEAARRLTRFTAPFNFAGLPALSVPCGFTDEGLPIGLQMISRHWGEAKALQAGCAFEQATGWHRRRPDIQTRK
ncbi:MAG: Asp-tRNA(Asn)/Glu-tRNA(Gln) amidotransferase subunit GatA [Deltaproteobacteria bacterium]|nr:Asp-tRNA(Asn)/Glu-tRNA(Gln) amidotransferase subunit GatA [Deltaproteobacteria bacterium]